MSYRINDIDLSTYGITPVVFQGQAFAVKGAFDFPKRYGTTEYDWGTETELFVSENDIEFDSRDIYFRGLIQATTIETLLSNLETFETLCKTGKLTFETSIGTYFVYLSGAIEVTRLSSLIYEINAKFEEPNVLFETEIGTATAGTGYKIDGYNLETDFGITVQKTSGLYSVPDRISVPTTDFYEITTYRKPKDISLKCLMMGSDLVDFKNKMGRLQSLLASSGLRTLTCKDGTTLGFYVRDGFSVKEYSNRIGEFTLKIRS